MSLKDEINNTNTQKENIKTVANNIDNKLVELGGEQATNLADVPNKMNGMISQYKKIAIGGRKRFNLATGDENELRIDINLNFTPTIIFCNVWRVSVFENDRFCGTADSRYNIKGGNDNVNDEYVNSHFADFKIKGGSISEKDFMLLLNPLSTERNFDVAWIAIG